MWITLLNPVSARIFPLDNYVEKQKTVCWQCVHNFDEKLSTIYPPCIHRDNVDNQEGLIFFFRSSMVLRAVSEFAISPSIFLQP